MKELLSEDLPDFALQQTDHGRPTETSATIRNYHKRLLDARPQQRQGFYELLNSLNCYHAYQYLSGTRSKPWDERELDCLEGFKFLSFVLTTISQTAFSLVITDIINLFGFLKVVRLLFVTAVVSANVAMETFVFLSVFLTAHRCF